jgi:urease accessory protein
MCQNPINDFCSATANTMIELLELLQLSDSAVPIGGTAHSFGLEMLAAMNHVAAENLDVFLADYLQETGFADAIYCRAAWRSDANGLGELNQELSALRLSSELRQASVVLGRRLLRLCHACHPHSETEAALAYDGLHHSIAFGFICGVLGIDQEMAVAAFLHQTAAALLSASQRLLPVGQEQASRILWELKPVITRIVEASRQRTRENAYSFVPLLELASMRHRRLETRLFIS